MASASDNFDRANNASLGANWTEDSGDWQINSNFAIQVTASGAYRKARYTATPPDTNDHYSEAIVRTSSSAIGAGTIVRGAASATVTYYSYIIFGGDAGYLAEITAGGETILDTGAATSTNTDYTIRTIANGTTISGTRGGVEDVSATDGSLTSGQWGLSSFGGENATATRWNDWVAADLAAPPAPTGGFMTTMSGIWGP